MNKKTKNIVSVLQSMSAAVLCTLCTVLFLASCTDESLVDNPHAQNALRTVSVDLGMPQDKPAFGEGTTSRADLGAQTVEILLGDSTLAVSRAESAEGGTESSSPSGSESTIPTWVNGNQILVKIDAGSTQGRLTLQYIAPAAIPAPASGEETQTATAGWYLMKADSYVKYTGDAFTAYNAQGVTPMIAGDTSDNADKLAIGFTQPLTLHLDWTASQPTVSIIYAPDMQWSLAQDNTVSMEQKNSATAATTAPELWTVAGNDWTTNQARLRVNTGTGTGNAGDVVTLTSSAFDSAWEDEPTGGIFTATTDKYGNAYFYGITDGTLDGSEGKDFIVELRQMRVPVQQSGDEEESNTYSRSIALDEENFIITLDEPITLLEASDLVPVTLDDNQAYKLMADVKRTASAKANLSVIDGQCGITEATGDFYVGTDDDVAAVKKQIETAVAMGVTDFTVVNQLAIYDQINLVNPTCAATVVGEAIRRIGAANSNARISLTLSDATMVFMCGFYGCKALQSVSAPAVTAIEMAAFYQCTALQSVLAPAATAIGDSAFDGCSSLQSVSLGNVTTISCYAFQNTQVTNLNFDYLTVLGSDALSGLTFSNLEIAKEAASDAYIDLHQKAFRGCTLTGSVTFHKVVYESGNYDGLTQENAFEGVATSELDLFLHAEQPIDQISVSNDGKLKWAGAEWASITLLDGPNGTAGTKYYIDNGMPTVEVDGTCGITGDNPIGEDTHVSAMKLKIKVVADAANADAPAKVIVKNGLASFGALPRTVVGQAIHDLASNEESSNYGTISITIADATELPSGAFFECYALESVTFNKTVVIGKAAFSNCTALESVKFIGSGNTIGNAAFKLCALTGIDWTKVTMIDGSAFWNCTLTGMVDLSQVTTVVDDAFQFANVSNCDLVLPAGQESNVDVSNDGKLMWAYGEGWNSITVGGVQYKAVGNELYAVIDGSVTDVNTVKAQIQAVPANTKILVTNGLAAYTKENPTPTDIYAGTVVGEAIRQLTSQAMPTNTSEENYIGSISLVLDDGITEIPYIAFRGCKELGSVVANGVTTIGIGAFYECTSIKELTFGQTFVEVGMNAFGLDRRESGYCWSYNCVLTLKSGQLLLMSGSSSNKYTSHGEEQVQEGTDKLWCDTAWKEIKLVRPQPI